MACMKIEAKQAAAFALGTLLAGDEAAIIEKKTVPNWHVDVEIPGEAPQLTRALTYTATAAVRLVFEVPPQFI
jgi:hypothetical protein